jgi:copper transport protein
MSPSGDRVGAVLRASAVLVAGALALLLFAPPAGAHAVLLDSDPADGAVLAQAPHSLRLRFTDDISARFRSAQLVDADGDLVTGAVLRRDTGPRDLVLDLPPIPAGGYGVLWRVLAQSDGHTSSGAVVFNVGAAPASVPGAATAAPRRADALAGAAPARPLDVLRRWLGLCLLAAAIGGLAVTRLVLAPAARASGPGYLQATISAARRRVLAMVAIAAAAGAAVGLIDLLAETRRLAFADTTLPGVLAGTRWGQLWLVHEWCLVVLAVLAVRLRSRRDSRLFVATEAALVAGLVLVEALGSHAASGAGTAVPVLAAHVLTACIWLGALPALLVTLWPRRGEAADPAAVVGACRGRLFALLAASVLLLVTSGLATAGRQVGDVASLTTTGYGRALLVKAGLVAAMIAFGAWNALRLHRLRPDGSPSTLSTLETAQSQGLRPFKLGPARPTPSPRRSVLVEAGAGLLVLAATAVLVEAVPAREPARPLQPAATVTTLSTSVADLVVSVSVSPNRPGLNSFTVHAASSRRPPPAPIDRVSLRLDQAGDANEVSLREVSPGEYFGTGVLAPTDQLRLTPIGLSLALSRDGRSLAVPFRWSMAEPPEPARQPHVRRLAPYADGLAGIVIVGALVGAAAVAARRRGREPHGVQGERERVLEGVR